jgi:hypothetical protein
MTIDCVDYESCSKIINAENALYKTNNYKIIEIEDFNHKSIDFTKRYKKNINYNNKITFWLNKQIAFYMKINIFKLYKQSAIPKVLHEYSHPIDKGHNDYVSIYKEQLETYFNDILENGCNGIYKSYYENGALEEEYFHNNGEIEGVYKKYHPNGKLKETCNYLNGLKHGKWTQYHDNEKVKYWDDYLNGEKQLDWRFFTKLIVPKDCSSEKNK